MEIQCKKCRSVIKDKDKNIIETCIISAKQNNPSLIILGITGKCPYYEEKIRKQGNK